MAITFNEQSRVFHLQTSKTSYIIHLWREKYLMHVYWGKKIKTPDIANAVVNRVGVLHRIQTMRIIPWII